jgi:hypothetical protein
MVVWGILVAFLLRLGPLKRKSIPINQNISPLHVFSGIAEKMGGVMELLVGQKKITEANIEATLKVHNLRHCNRIYTLIYLT